MEPTEFFNCGQQFLVLITSKKDTHEPVERIRMNPFTSLASSEVSALLLDIENELDGSHCINFRNLLLTV